MLTGPNGVISGSGLDKSDASKICSAIQFLWGGDNPAVFENSAAYVANTTNITVDGFNIGLMTALPELSIDMGKQQGGSKDSPVEVEMKIVNPITELINGYMFQPIWANVFELDPSNPQITTRQLFYGRVSNLIINKNHRADTVGFRLNGNKAQLDKIPIGLRAGTTCQWSLGDKTCDVDLVPLRESPMITDIQGRTITVDALVNQSNRYWQGGYFRFEKLHAGIRSYTGGLTFETFRGINPNMIGETIEMTPGCDKTIETCRTKFNNEERFGGFGYAIPAYTPIWENG